MVTRMKWRPKWWREMTTPVVVVRPMPLSFILAQEEADSQATADVIAETIRLTERRVKP